MSISHVTESGYWSRNTYNEDGYLINIVDKAGYIDIYDWNADYTELTYHMETDEKRYSNQHYKYVYDENGNISKIYKNGGLYTSFEYTLFEDCSPWAYALSTVKPVKQRL